MRQPAHQLIKRSLVTAAVCAAAGAALLLPDILQRRPVGTISLVFAAGTFGAALILFWRGWRAADALGLGIETIRTGVLNLVADREALLPPELGAGQPPEIEDMLGSLTLYQDAIDRERRGPDRRLVTVLGALASGVVVMTEQGQVSLLNTTARELLGAERARVGTSIFAALSRESVTAALARIAGDGQLREALFERLDGVKLQGRIVPLPGDEGAIIIFPPLELERHRPGVEFDLKLHDVPPVAEAPSLDTPLDDLPVLVIDTETTGLDVAVDRIVSIGAVCAHGSRLFKSRMLDDLVSPGVPIPAISTRVHGITDEMVAGARSFPEVHADLERLSRHRVIVGHNVPFDLTILRRECERHGRPWEHPVFVDTLRLASLLNPSLGRHDLETLADLYRIEIAGRHTALGDALVTAELYFRLLPRLQQQGFRTLGDLLRFHCTEAVDVIAGQRQAGWITAQPDRLRPR